MRKSISNLYRLLLAVLLMTQLFFIYGCGRKTLPIPPQDAVPVPITDLNAHQDGNKIVLNWTIPKRTTAGSKLPQIKAFQLSRAVLAEDACTNCPVPFSSTLELPLEQVIKNGDSGQGQYSETLLRPGHRYIYKLRTKAGWRLVSDDSNQVSFLWLSPPEAPQGIKAVAGDEQVTLQWQAPNKLVNGQPLTDTIIYKIYRGLDNNHLSPLGEPVKNETFTDVGLINGRSYYYKVTAEIHRPDARVEGLASPVVIARPHDLTAPPPPRNLLVVKIATGIKLLWERTMSSDLAGYMVYRRLPKGKLALIGKVDAADNFFIDKTPPAGATSWYYAITSFDRAAPANESSTSKEIIYESF